RGAQQLHGAHEFTREDLDRAIDTGAPTRHEAVEVGPPDHREPRAECDGGHDVGPVHDAGVDADLDVPAHLAHHIRKQMERDGRAIELAPAVIGEHDAVDPAVGERLRVVDVLHALDHDLAGPHAADDVEVV